MDFLAELNRLTGGKIKTDVILATYTTFRLGGPAKYFYIADDKEILVKLLNFCKKNSLPFFILGGGSNILVSDKGFSGLVIKMGYDRIKISDEVMECGAGVPLGLVVGRSVAAGLVGLGWAVGIPGTVGGAACGNAGAYGHDMAGNVKYVEVLRDGKVKKVDAKKCQFDYRSSIFKKEDNRDIVLTVVLQLKRGDVEEQKKKMREIMKERRIKFSNNFSAGSVFKNIVVSVEGMKEFKEKNPDFPDKFASYLKIPAGWLIDQCGLRGKTVGGAQIYENHAGIVINTGEAKAEDVIILLSIIKQKVRTKFSIQLMEEIIYIGF